MTPTLDDQRGWDAIPNPTRTRRKLYSLSFVYPDYVKTALDRRLRYGEFAATGLDEYIGVTLTMARVFQVLGVTTDVRPEWVVWSFTKASDKEIEKAAKSARIPPPAAAYRFVLLHVEPAKRAPRKTLLVSNIEKEETFLANPATVLRLVDAKKRGWKATRF